MPLLRQEVIILLDILTSILKNFEVKRLHSSAIRLLKNIENDKMIANHSDTKKILIRKGMSGCGLAWNFFFPDQAMPSLFSYAQDRDLWVWQLYKSMEINAALRAMDLASIEIYEIEAKIDKVIAEWDMDKLVRRGSTILAKQRKLVNEAASNSNALVIKGHLVPVVHIKPGENRYKALQSEIGQKLLENHPEAPFSASFYSTPYGSFKFSLRSRADFDCSKVAQQFEGGGGHKQASGFEIKDLKELEA